MNDNILLHAINVNSFKFMSDETLKKLEQILIDNYLYSRNLQKVSLNRSSGFNGNDYISLCDYNKVNKELAKNKDYRDYNSFNAYISKGLALGFSKEDLTIITPILINQMNSFMEAANMKQLGLDTKNRYSDYIDEVQIKEKVSLNNLECLTLPIDFMTNPKKSIIYSKDMILDFLRNLREMLEKYNHVVNIYDLSSGINLDNPENLDKILK